MSRAIPEPRLPTLRLVQTPMRLRWCTRLLLLMLLCSPAIILALPYQQAVGGSGTLIAYAQEERVTPINAPIDGRIDKWHVKEGQSVKKGAPIVDIQDNDPYLLKHLQEQKQALGERKKATQARINSIVEQVAKLEQARDEAIRAANDRLQAAKQDVTVSENSRRRAQAALALAEENFKLQEGLFKDNLGLTSRIDFIRAQQDLEDRRAAVEQANAGVNKANDLVRALGADVQRITNQENAVIQAARANLETANDSLAAVERDLVELEIRITRQNCQAMTSPVDGVVWQVSSKATTGQLVKAGDTLVEIVPDTLTPVVELMIDGNDLPLLMGQTGQHVRLQFEGYPAVQFIGWPSLAFGTFGGRVMVIDPTDDGKGRFRILVEPDPDPNLPGDDWPGLIDAQNMKSRNLQLRQGMRVNGWVFLNRVSLGWEIWRRINGFPPVVPEDGEKFKEKPPKFIKKPK
jgi:multidrug efflux pump subunit AcrA (membrane-fusion protein)